jgi:hypothetical protein
MPIKMVFQLSEEGNEVLALIAKPLAILIE